MSERIAAKALVLPFQRQDQNFPTSENPWLFLNASVLPNAVGLHEGLVCEQSFRPIFCALQKHSYVVEAEVLQKAFAGALVLIDKSKSRSQDLIARAVEQCRENAAIMVAGEKDTGIASVKKWVSQRVQLVDTFAKYHSQVFTFLATEEAKLVFSKLKPNSSNGLFGGGKIDAGSQLLVSTFDDSIGGDIADFGAGTGFLCQALAERSKPEALHLYEAEKRALSVAESKREEFSCPVFFYWHDLTAERVTKRFDWVIMNPPFHFGKTTDPAIGQAMIKMARISLRPGGKLRLVGNRQLPYEQTLQKHFGAYSELVSNNGFKVLQARC